MASHGVPSSPHMHSHTTHTDHSAPEPMPEFKHNHRTNPDQNRKLPRAPWEASRGQRGWGDRQDSSSSSSSRGQGGVGDRRQVPPALPLASVNQSQCQSQSQRPRQRQSQKQKQSPGLLVRGLCQSLRPRVVVQCLVLLSLVSWAPLRCSSQGEGFPEQIASPPPSTIFQGDLDTLLSVKATLAANQPVHGRPPIQALDSWQATSDPCNPQTEWVGVTCVGTRVTILDLGGYRFTGPIPTEIGQLINLYSLLLPENFFNGTIPESLAALTKLTELNMESNLITGPIPDYVSAFKKLKTLNLASNKLEGPITPSLAQMTSLTYLDLSGNRLTGELPDLTPLLNLEHLILMANQLTGTLPYWLDSLPRLQEVSLRKNQFYGSIPEYTLSLSLEQLYLGFNNLSGSLPSTIGDLHALTVLFMASNDLVGPIPDSFSNLTSLALLDLSSNRGLSGPIPDYLGTLDSLSLVQLSGCSFSGPIPESLTDLTDLEELYLDDNQLTGPIPESLGNLTSLTQLYLSQNDLVGPLPPSTCQLTDLYALGLSNNRLNGSIPPCLMAFEGLRTLTLSDNFFTGELPTPTTEKLDLQAENNCLNSPAPNQLPSSNCATQTRPPLGPPVAPAGPPETPETPYTDTGTPAGIPPTPTAGTYPAQAPMDSPLAYPAPTSSGGFPLWGSILLVILAALFLAFLAYSANLGIGTWAAAGGNRPDQLPVAEFSLSKIKKATKNFSTVYGRGSFGTVYLGEDFRKGHPEPRVIVKRAAEPQKMGEFMFKCRVEVLARARHRYLVNLLGYCIGKGERILVYEYLPNGTLFDRLHRPELEPLPWEVRVRIAVSVACALEHLHHGLTPPLVHPAVTSSNILLAADMSAKLSDFGIARGSFGTAGSFDNTPRRSRSKARGGAGLSGPGPGSGRSVVGSVSSSDSGASQGILQLEKVDVYGFGVVVLELITGQKAMKEVHITSVAAPFLEDPQMMPLMVDPQLGGYFNEQELIELATIARDCVRDDPGARPSMRDVLQCMESRLRSVDAAVFENIDVGDDITDAYAGAGGSTVPVLFNPPHVRHTPGTPMWPSRALEALESFASSVKSTLLSPGAGRQGGAHPQGSPEDFEMSTLLVMTNAGSSENSSGSSSGRLLPR